MANLETHSKHLVINVPSDRIQAFSPLLQQRFLIEARIGCSIRSLLCDQIGIEEAYLDNRIQTLFLDGKPVDDVDSAIVKEDSTLALSAAMPGFVGAVMRRGGYYASMRSGITHWEESASVECRDGRIGLKLFNLLIKEIGPLFLLKGLWIDGKLFEDFVKGRSEDFWKGCGEMTWYGQPISLERFREMSWPEGWIRIELRT